MRAECEKSMPPACGVQRAIVRVYVPHAAYYLLACTRVYPRVRLPYTLLYAPRPAKLLCVATYCALAALRTAASTCVRAGPTAAVCVRRDGAHAP